MLRRCYYCSLIVNFQPPTLFPDPPCPDADRNDLNLFVYVIIKIDARAHTGITLYITGTIVVVDAVFFILLPRAVATFAPMTFDFVSHFDAIWLLRRKRVTD